MDHIYVQKARFACPHCGKRIRLADVVEIDEDEEDLHDEDEDDDGD